MNPSDRAVLREPEAAVRDLFLPCLSILQPYAWLIVNGYKDIENRGWATKLRGGRAATWNGTDDHEQP